MIRKTALRTSTSIPYEIKVILDELQMSDERPFTLVKWTREVFKAGKKFERTNDEIAEWVIEYAREKDYSERQIYSVLKQNGYVRQVQDHSFKRSGRQASTFNYIVGLKHLTQAITELDEQQIERVHNPVKVADQAQPNILDIATRTTEAEKAALLHYVEIAIELLTRLRSTLRQSGKTGIRLEP